MNGIKNDEKLMYKVMKALYDSGIPISFKGSMVLKACLLEVGYSEPIRQTVDIDANWYSDNLPTLEQMTLSLQKAIDDNNINLEIYAKRAYGNKKSAGFVLLDKLTKDKKFSMDIDVNKPFVTTQIYQIDEFRFRGISPLQMLADKIYVLSTDIIFRRVKDMIDLYYFSCVFEFDKDVLLETIHNNGRTLESFDAFLSRKEELKYAYGKFRVKGSGYKPPFNEIYESVYEYTKCFFSEELELVEEQEDCFC